MQKLVIVGGGMASARLLEELHARTPDRHAIEVHGEEPEGHYNRVLLSPVLAGEMAASEIITHPPAWHAARGIRFLGGDPVVAIDRARRRLRTRSGAESGYDQLVLATGSSALRPTLPGMALPGVLAFRDFRDLAQLEAGIRRGGRALVVGGGVLGLEAAMALRHRGLEVCVLNRSGALMERQLDAEASGLLRAELERQGLRFELHADTQALLGEGRVTALQLRDGRVLAADLVLFATGIQPRIALAQAAGLACGRGIQVDDALRSSDAAISAVGECLEHRGQCYGLVAPVYEQARVLAARLAGEHAAHYPGSATSLKLKVSGIELFSAGEFVGAEGDELLRYRDPRRGIYKKLVLRAGRLVGAVLIGDARDSSWYFELIQSGQTIGAWRRSLLFGRAYCLVADAA